jgi:uncharacterized protein (UPF0332 family)
MIELGGTFLDKAKESLTGARTELEGGRYSNSANRSYYAVFQAAIHAILAESVKPPGRGDHWDHGWVHGQFNGLLIHRRHRYSSDLRAVLNDNYDVRVQADYTPNAVSEVMASRALRRAERFVGAIVQREEQS